MKDIFVDTNLATNLATPLNDHFKDFLKWLYTDGALVINSKLITEFVRGNQTLSVVLNKLTIAGRINNIKASDLKCFKFSKSTEKILLSNYEDRIHLKTVLLSNRKLALSKDVNFNKDINGFKKIDNIKPTCADCPSKLTYI